MGRARPIEERFWEKVIKGARCWEWHGGRDQWGYGLIWLNGKTERAHRLSFFWAGLELPPGKLVLHRCDNARCVNPKHLYAGSPKENMADMFSRGRAKPGGRLLPIRDVAKK